MTVRPAAADRVVQKAATAEAQSGLPPKTADGPAMQGTRLHRQGLRQGLDRPPKRPWSGISSGAGSRIRRYPAKALQELANQPPSPDNSWIPRSACARMSSPSSVPAKPASSTPARPPRQTRRRRCVRYRLRPVLPTAFPRGLALHRFDSVMPACRTGSRPDRGFSPATTRVTKSNRRRSGVHASARKTRPSSIFTG